MRQRNGEDSHSQSEYPCRLIERIVNRCSQQLRHDGTGQTVGAVPEKEGRWVSILYVQGMSEAITTVLRPLGIRVAHRASRWKWHVCTGIKDEVPPEKRKGVVYKVPCKDCNAVYVGETLCTLPTWLQEHQQHT